MVGLSFVFRYFLQVVIVGSTMNYVFRLGTLLFCYRYVEKLSPNPGTCLVSSIIHIYMNIIYIYLYISADGIF